MTKKNEFVPPGTSTRTETEHHIDFYKFLEEREKLIQLVNENPNDHQLGTAFRKYMTENYSHLLKYEQK